MKIKLLICKVFLAGLLLPILLNCKKEAIKTAPTATISALTNITATSASSGGEITADGGATITARGVCWSTNQNPTTSDAKTSNQSGTGSFISSITGLIPGATYNVKAYATNSVGTGYSSQSTFTTLALAPILSTTDLSEVTSTTANSGGNITNDGGSAVTARGVCWSTSQNPTIADSKISSGTGSGSFTSAIMGLNPGATYYVRAYATNSIGTGYGNQITATATAILPVLTTSIVSALTSTTATSGGNITSDGGAAVTARGVCWGTSASPTIANSKTTDGTATGTFTSPITGLIPGATYYIRAYATNSIGNAYGNEVTATSTAILPTLSTVTATSILTTSVTSGGNITSDGGAIVTARGVCWSSSQNPTTTDSKTTNGTGSGTFSSSITGLTPGATYYIRSYATNSIGTAYGNEVTATSTAALPTLSTATVTSILTTTATSGGNIISNGGSVVTVRGVCWSTTANPTIGSSKTADGTGSGTFSSLITGLAPGATYYIRSYATNSIGTAYGNEVTATSTATLPTLSTVTVTSILTTSTTSGGNITSDGGSSVTARGVCWSTSQNPTTTDSKTTNGIGSGTFSSSITGLTPGATYYIRAYATNSIGTVYGNEVTATSTATLPTLSTVTVTSILTTSVTSGGNITSDGGSSVTARGVCWSTTANPTIGSSKTTDGTGSGIFSSSITGLAPGATYYIRAYATNSIGTAYGNEVTATSTAAMPALSTATVTSILTTSATSGGNITSNGGSVVTARGVCWSTTANPTIASSKTTDGTGSGSFTSSIIGLAPGATYYIRAYATNSIGTVYGNEVTATSTAALPTLSTTTVTSILTTSATSGGNITSNGGSSVTARGVCWSTTANPTIASSKTTDGTGSGVFSSSLTGLTPGATYYIRAYATNSIGTVYGNQLTLTMSAILPVISTNMMSSITETTAIGGGSITSDGGEVITARGVCLSITQNPTTSNTKINNGSGVGSFNSNIAGLAANSTYYLRAYATNSIGTVYGSEMSFSTLQGNGNMVTDFDGNVYHTVTIGTQVWMVENLKTTTYRNGDPIQNVTGNTAWSALRIGAYCWYNNDATYKNTNYGALYNWYTVSDSRNMAPWGWHVPTDAEWTNLTTFLGESVAGLKLRETGTAHWFDTNTYATNSSGFTALPGGQRDGFGLFDSGPFNGLGTMDFWWSSTAYNATDAWARYVSYYSSSVGRDNGNNFNKVRGYSVRCVKD